MERPTDTNCIFCNIANQKIPTKLIFESERVVAFPDLHPQAPTHILIVPKGHLSSIVHAETGDQLLLGELLLAAKTIAADLKLDHDGYRLNLNAGYNGGQTVEHIHLHLLGGRRFDWPPG